MSISTNRFLNKIITGLGRIGGGGLERGSISLLYKLYAMFPPKHVKQAASYYEKKKEETEYVKSLLADDKSKYIYQAMIEFRSTYDMKKHPGYTLDDIYFVKDIVGLSEEEVFVDAGAFDGDTIRRFLEHAREFKKIVAFEPDKQNYDKMSGEFGKRKNIVLRNTGVWSENTELSFLADASEVSKVLGEEKDAPKGYCTVKVEAIDTLEVCREATYIKMDIEGAEMMALKGARETILKNHPKLAVSIYHKDEDMIEIPMYIHSLEKEYKLYVRQHSHSFYDTVLYCVK